MVKSCGLPSSVTRTSNPQAAAGDSMSEKSNAEEPTLDRVRAAKKTAEKTFAALAKVVGIGITRIGGVYGLKVNIESAPATVTALPAEIEGCPVHVEVVGTVKKRPTRR
jgi:preprotein translocase subunit Sss1